MIIRFFRSGFFSQYLSVLIISLFIWMPVFLSAPEVLVYPGFNPLYDLLANLLSPFPLLASILSFLIMYILAFFFNAILSNNQLQLRTGSIAMLIFVVFHAHSPQLTAFTPFLAGLPFVLGALHSLIQLYSSKNVIMTIFHASFFAGLSALFYFPFIVFIVVVYGALIITRVSSFREWIIPVVGFFAPLFFLATYYFLMDELLLRFHELSSIVVGFGFHWPTLGLLDWAIYGIILIMFFLAVNWLGGSESDNSIGMRKRIGTLWLIFVVLILSMGLDKGSARSVGLLMLIPSVFVSYYLSYAKRLRWAQILLVVLVCLVLAGHFNALLQ
jgi:hypothetical protein